MILDIILIALLVSTMVFGYKEGCVGIVAKIASLLVALVLAYILASSVGEYISSTSIGETISNAIEANTQNIIKNSEKSTIISAIQEKLEIKNNKQLINKIQEYAFIAIGFVVVFIGVRIVLLIAKKILNNIFELPVLKTFNKLGGVIASAVLFVIEISVLLAIIKGISTMSFMSGIVKIIHSSVITKTLYDHNIITNLIISKII